MYDEKLIELVRRNPALFDLQNSKYSDNTFKEKIWNEISKELNVPGKKNILVAKNIYWN